MAHSNYNKKDHYYFKAKEEGFLARSAYKLQEMQKRFQLLRRGDKVFDLGCAPGAWSQVALPMIGREGKLIGVDLVAVDKSTDKKLDFPNARFFKGDAYKLTLDDIPEAPFDCVMSDMAPKTTGLKLQDQVRSAELCMRVVEICDEFLKPGGNLVMKIFEGQEAQDVAKAVQARFESIKRHRPQSTRQESVEIYILGFNKLEQPKS